MAAVIGLSDHHDAVVNLFWRLAAGMVPDVASPTALLHYLPQQHETDHDAHQQLPLRFLLVHGVADVDVPASFSVEFAGRAWAHGMHAELLVLPNMDHYEAAG